MKNRDKGFTLIELLIVVAIILIIAAIAIPNLLRSKMAANEASAVGSLRTITTAGVTYSSTYGNGYAPTLGALGGASTVVVATCSTALLIDSVLSAAGAGNVSTKSGYTFTYVPGVAVATSGPGCAAPGVNSYTITALPITVGTTSQRGFFADTSGVIRFTTDGTAPTAASTPLQ
jgi:prepilin-type N-terminal cleavage/methylation domain-containing protein